MCAGTLLRHATERLDQLLWFQHRRAWCNFGVGLFFFSCKAFLELEKLQKGKLEEAGAEGKRGRGEMPCEKVGEVQSRRVKVKQSDCIPEGDRENTSGMAASYVCISVFFYTI